MCVPASPAGCGPEKRSLGWRRQLPTRQSAALRAAQQRYSLPSVSLASRSRPCAKASRLLGNDHRRIRGQRMGVDGGDEDGRGRRRTPAPC